MVERPASERIHPSPFFDDQHSYTIEVSDGETAIDAASLAALVNRAFDYKGSALSNLRLSFDQGWSYVPLDSQRFSAGVRF